jgi:hypothetical protein
MGLLARFRAKKKIIVVTRDVFQNSKTGTRNLGELLQPRSEVLEMKNNAIAMICVLYENQV